MLHLTSQHEGATPNALHKVHEATQMVRRGAHHRRQADGPQILVLKDAGVAGRKATPEPTALSSRRSRQRMEAKSRVIT